MSNPLRVKEAPEQHNIREGPAAGQISLIILVQTLSYMSQQIRNKFLFLYNNVMMINKLGGSMSFYGGK